MLMLLLLRRLELAISFGIEDQTIRSALESSNGTQLELPSQCNFICPTPVLKLILVIHFLESEQTFGIDRGLNQLIGSINELCLIDVSCFGGTLNHSRLKIRKS